MTRALALGAAISAAAACGGSPRASWDPPPSSGDQASSPARGEGDVLSLEEAMRAVPIAMYMTTWCPVCRRARGWLEEGGYDFVEYDVETDRRAGRLLRSLNPRGTIPMFDVDGRILIGFEPSLLRETIRRAAEERAGS